MPYQLHTRAGLEPPYSSTQKRYLNTGSGGAQDGNIGHLIGSQTVIIELETQLGEYAAGQGNLRNILFAGDINNTSSSGEVGIHWYSDGRIGVSGGGNSRRRYSASTYSQGDTIKIRWELSFPSSGSGVVGTQTLYIDDVFQDSGPARSDAFAGVSSLRAFALNSHANNNHNSVQTEFTTDQFIRRLYVNWVDANYERNWIFDQQTGFTVLDSLGSGDSLFLYGGNGINSLGENWPTDDSQWVPFDDGGTVDPDPEPIELDPNPAEQRHEADQASLTLWQALEPAAAETRLEAEQAELNGAFYALVPIPAELVLQAEQATLTGAFYQLTSNPAEQRHESEQQTLDVPTGLQSLPAEQRHQAEQGSLTLRQALAPAEAETRLEAEQASITGAFYQLVAIPAELLLQSEQASWPDLHKPLDVSRIQLIRTTQQVQLKRTTRLFNLVKH